MPPRLHHDTVSPEPLSAARQYPGFLVLLWAYQTIYLSGGSSLWTMDLQGNPKLLTDLPMPWFLKQAARFRHLRRLCRVEMRELLRLPSGALIGSMNRQIMRFTGEADGFRTVFQVTDGGKPKGLVQTPQGHIFVGEYWGNPQRRPLRIWGSTDQGRHWDLVYRLPAGSAKHIHKLVWDPCRHGLWILTGDRDGECALLFTPDEFKSVSEIARGGQMFRSCNIFCRPEGLFYGTDTERDQNWFVFLNIETGNLEKIWPLPGSCLYSAQMAGQYFISTNVEPSQVNHYRYAVLWSSPDLQQWSKVVELEKDPWPGEYFGFGRMILPLVQGECPAVVFSAAAVKRLDCTIFIIDAASLERFNS